MHFSCNAVHSLISIESFHLCIRFFKKTSCKYIISRCNYIESRRGICFFVRQKKTNEIIIIIINNNINIYLLLSFGAFASFSKLFLKLPLHVTSIEKAIHAFVFSQNVKIHIARARLLADSLPLFSIIPICIHFISLMMIIICFKYVQQR